MKKRLIKFFAVISAILICFGAVACGEKGSKDANTLRIFTYTGDEYDGIRKDSVLNAIEEKTGFKLKFEGASTADYWTKLSPKMNTGDYPDIMWVEDSNSNFLAWANPKQDLLWNIDELLLGNEERYPYLSKLVYSNQYVNLMFYDGHYIVPYVNTATAWAIYYRADWLVEAGFVDENGNAKAPETLDEFEAVMKAFTGNNLFRNGTSGQTWGISPNTDAFYTNALYGAFDVTPDWDIDDAGNVTYMYTNEKIRPYLKWMNAMYEKGWIHPTFNQNKAFLDRDIWYSGKVGCIMTNGEAHMEWVVGNLLTSDPAAEVIVGPPLKGTGNTSPLTGCVLGVKDSQGFSNWGGYYGGYVISKNVADPYKALDFLEYMVSPEGSMLRLYGIKDKHYSIDDGKFTANLEGRNAERSKLFATVTEEDGSTSYAGLHKVGSLFGYAVDWDHYEETGEIVVGTDISSLYPKYKTLVSNALEYAKILKTPKLLNVTAYPASINSAMNQVMDIANSYINPVIMGQKNLNSDWNSMLADCNGAGYANVKAVIKETAKSLGII